MKTKLFLLVFSIFISCSKESTDLNQSVTYKVNGYDRKLEGSTSFIDLVYSKDTISYIQSNLKGNSRSSIVFAVVNHPVIKDKLVLNYEYKSKWIESFSDSTLLQGNITYHDLRIIFTDSLNNKLNANFYGVIKAYNNVSRKNITDSITNGKLINISYKKTKLIDL